MLELTWLLRKAKTVEDIEELVKIYVNARKVVNTLNKSLAVNFSFKGEEISLTLF
jgi:hypothetical protein